MLIDLTGELLYQRRELGANACGGDLLDCAVVLSLEVKEAILGHDFCHGESCDGVADAVASAGHLCARNEALEEDLIAFVKGEGNGLVQCLKALNLRGRYTGASSIGLRKERKAEALDKLLRGGASAIAQQAYGVCDTQVRVGGEVAVAVVFIEGQCFGERASRIVGDTDEVKVTLQETVFSGRAVHGDQGIVELDMLTSEGKAEVALIDEDGLLRLFSIGAYIPSIALNDDEVGGKSAAINPREKACGTAQRYGVFARESTSDNGDIISFHRVYGQLGRI